MRAGLLVLACFACKGFVCFEHKQSNFHKPGESSHQVESSWLVNLKKQSLPSSQVLKALKMLLLITAPEVGWQVIGGGHPACTLSNCQAWHGRILARSYECPEAIQRCRGQPLAVASRGNGKNMMDMEKHDLQKWENMYLHGKRPTEFGKERRRSIFAVLLTALSSVLQRVPCFADKESVESLDAGRITQLLKERRESSTGAPPPAVASSTQPKKVQDFVEATIDLPLRPEKPLTIKQAFGILKSEDAVKVSKGDIGDRTGAYMWLSGMDLGRGASTGKLRMSLDESIRSVPIRGKRVLELGCGTGLVGICAVIGGATSVLMTDANPELLRNAQRNIDLNLKGQEGRVTLQQLRWGNDADEAEAFKRGPFDIILASEVAYERSVFPKLFGTMRRCLEASKRKGVESPTVVLQQNEVVSDSGDGGPFQGVKGVLEGAESAGLKVTAVAEVGETTRIVLNLK